MKYNLHIKSHGAEPDYEDSISASSLQEAIEKFSATLDFPESIIKESVSPANITNEKQTLIDGIRYDIAEARQALAEAISKLEEVEALDEVKDEF
jgi:hypothetical protein